MGCNDHHCHLMEFYLILTSLLIIIISLIIGHHPVQILVIIVMMIDCYYIFHYIIAVKLSCTMRWHKVCAKLIK